MSLCGFKVEMMMSNVSAVTEDFGAGSPETILGWNMPSGFLG